MSPITILFNPHINLRSMVRSLYGTISTPWVPYLINVLNIFQGSRKVSLFQGSRDCGYLNHDHFQGIMWLLLEPCSRLLLEPYQGVMYSTSKDYIYWTFKDTMLIVRDKFSSCGFMSHATLLAHVSSGTLYISKEIWTILWSSRLQQCHGQLIHYHFHCLSSRDINLV